MILRKYFASSALAAAILFAAAPASAETLRVGAKVTDPQGGEVGTITAVDSQYVTVQTDRHQARLPVASFTPTDSAVLLGLSRDQLNGQLDQALAQAQQAVAVGAVVHDRDGAVIGPVTAVDGESVTVTFGEQPVRFPRSAIVPGQAGRLIVGVTVADLRAQAQAQAPAPAQAPSGADASAGSN